jgi:biopolymer transport protein ExbD
MNFRKPRPEDPEINLIAFIDVLLVVLIFLMMSTTYSKFTELQVNLPTAEAEQLRERPAEIIVAVSGDGRYAVNRNAVAGRSVDALSAALAAAARDLKEPVIIVSADATSPVGHQRARCGAPRRTGAPDLRGANRRRGHALSRWLARPRPSRFRCSGRGGQRGRRRWRWRCTRCRGCTRRWP